MKLLTIFLFVACMGASASGKGQTISLSLKNTPLEVAFRQIEQQSVYRFVYTKEQMKTAGRISLDIKSSDITAILHALFKEQPLSFTIDHKYVIIKSLEATSTQVSVLTDEIRGRLVNEQNDPVVGATITIKGTSEVTTSKADGSFLLTGQKLPVTLVITGAEIERQEITVTTSEFVLVRLIAKVGELDQVVMMAYGKTTRRLNTGNIGKVTAEEISRQPVSNPIAALQGRIPGVIITQTSGVPGAGFKVEIRGRSALDLSLSKNDPLYVLDGVPFDIANSPTNLLSSAANNPTSTSEGGLSALNSINPNDIESIEILKDADATAIYGSRGANGVILITTKFGNSGRTKVNMSLTNGFSKVTRTMKMLNTQQYVMMRKEAFANDGAVPTISTAPDILLWDTTRNTDIQKLLIGETAGYFDAQLSVSGGNQFTTFLIGGAIHRETTVMPGNFSDMRVSANISLNHFSTDKKFHLSFKTLYSNGNNNLVAADVSQYFRLPPNIKLYDSLGNLAWEEKGVTFASLNNLPNPLALLKEKYRSVNDNLSANLNLKYEAFKGLTIRTSIGYNIFRNDETSIKPKASIAPTSSTLPSSRFGNSNNYSWIVEPQIEYKHQVNKFNASWLIGSTFQSRVYKGTNLTGSNYSNDLLLNSISAAGSITASNFYTQYKYTALFSRINLNWDNQYILNLSVRRDGSSRFGPKEQFSNFGALGGAWVFSSQKWIQKKIKWLSFGKLRASYGLTGSDQIGDYKFYDLWSNIPPSYQGVSGLIPIGLFNPYFSWEVTRKFETGVDMGFLKDRILFTASYYRNRSSNQLTNYNLPSQSGFQTVVRNLPALVENSGLELSITSKNIKKDKFDWSSSINITFPRNKLISFPGLAASNYFTTYVEGSSLTVIRRYKYQGVDPTTGVYTFEDVDKDGSLSVAKDYQVLGDKDPDFYGGLTNSLTYHSFQLDFLIQFVKQVGGNYLSAISSYAPGRFFNQPAIVLNRWQKPGDNSTIQKFTNSNSSPAGVATVSRLNLSNGIYSDASFARLKNISLSFNPHFGWLKKASINNLKFFINAQNLFTITSFKGADPETQSYFQIPPLKTIAFGLNLTL